MSAADFLASIKAKFAEPEEYETALATFRDLQSRADRLSKALEIKHAAQERAEAERDAARALLREAGEVLRIWDEAHETGRSEPLFIARDAARAFLDKLAKEASNG